MEPDLEKVASDVRERAGVPLLVFQVLHRHPPAGRLLSREDGGIIQAALCSKGGGREREKGGGEALEGVRGGYTLYMF